MKQAWTNQFAFRLPQPVWSPPGEGGGGGEDDLDESDQLDMIEGDQGDQLEESGGDEELSLDDPDFLSKLFADEEADPNDPNSGLDDGDLEDVDSEAAQTKLADDMKRGIAAIAIPEEAIPENFDPADPKQLRDVFGAIQRQTVQDTIRIMWAPIAAAMNQTHVRMRAEMAEAVQSGVGENNIQSLLAKEIPNYREPGMKQVVGTLLTQARLKHKDPAKAVAATKKAMLGLGMAIGTSRPGQPGGRMTRAGARAATNSILDQFARLPQKASQPSGDRLKNRLQRPKA